MKYRALLGVLTGLFVASIASAAEIRILAAGATKEICLELIPLFEKSSGHKAVPTWAATVDIRKRMEANENFDIVIVGAQDIESFVGQGKVVRGSEAAAMKAIVGVAVRFGAAKPDIGTSEALKRTLLAATSIGYSTGPSGTHLLAILQRMGILDQVKPKLRQVPAGGRVSAFIASGEAEIGFQQVSELIHEPGIDYLGPLPADVQNVTVYTAGIRTGATEPQAASVFIKFLTAPDAARTVKKFGMEPG